MANSDEDGYLDVILPEKKYIDSTDTLFRDIQFAADICYEDSIHSGIDCPWGQRTSATPSNLFSHFKGISGTVPLSSCSLPDMLYVSLQINGWRAVREPIISGNHFLERMHWLCVPTATCNHKKSGFCPSELLFEPKETRFTTRTSLIQHNHVATALTGNLTDISASSCTIALTGNTVLRSDTAFDQEAASVSSHRRHIVRIVLNLTTSWAATSEPTTLAARLRESSALRTFRCTTDVTWRRRLRTRCVAGIARRGRKGKRA